jgi:periplasmic protein TonB
MSDRGSFSQCLVDGDEQSLQRARRVRQKALLASIIFEAALVLALLLWPLITLGKLPRQFFITPAPPYHGGSSRASAPSRGAPQNHPNVTRSTHHETAMFQPPHIPAHVQQSSSDEAPGINSGPDFGSSDIPGGGSGPGEFMPGGSETSAQSFPIPPPAAPEKPRRMSEGVMDAALIYKLQPQYPTAARLMRVSGTVRLQAIIGKDGSVRDVEILSGNPILVPAAIAAVREWRYRPTQLNGETVEVETYITVNFVLD